MQTLLIDYNRDTPHLHFLDRFHSLTLALHMELSGILLEPIDTTLDTRSYNFFVELKLEGDVSRSFQGSEKV